MNWDLVLHHLVQSVLFSGLGVVTFAVVFWLINKIVPFSIRKEIEEDQNVALGVLLGSIFIGTAIIISAAIQG